MMYRAENSERTSMSRVLVCLLALLGFLAASQSGFAQSSNGQITGLVTDSTGAAIDGARVTADNIATGVAYNGATNGADPPRQRRRGLDVVFSPATDARPDEADVAAAVTRLRKSPI